MFNLRRHIVRYWKQKVEDETFHPGVHGGVRFTKFNPLEHQQIRAILWLLCTADPTRNLESYVSKTQELGFGVHREFVRKIFLEWKWSWRRPSRKQLQKYTLQNRRRYAEYVEWIVQQDLRKVKFLDEVHFVSADVSRRRALSPRGVDVVIVHGEHFAETFSVTCMCCLEEEGNDPTYIEARVIDYGESIDFATRMEYQQHASLHVVASGALYY